jgi:cell division protein FtsN
MPKNYSKRRPTRYSSRKKSSRGNGGLWLGTVLLVVLLVLGLFYLKKLDHKAFTKHHPESPKKEAPAKAKPPKPTAVTVTPQTTPQPQFDFYTLLPKTQLPQPQVASPNKNSSSAQPISYVLHVASLKNENDADRLKAELTLLGFDVTLQTTTVNGTAWIRVEVGPYTSLTDAQADQERLRKNSISSALVKNPIVSIKVY